MEKTKRYNLIDCLCVGIDKVEVFHIQFEDETIFFCYVSSLKINLSKSCILGINCDEEKVIALVNSVRYEVGNWPLKYVGLPIRGNL